LFALILFIRWHSVSVTVKMISFWLIIANCVLAKLTLNVRVSPDLYDVLRVNSKLFPPKLPTSWQKSVLKPYVLSRLTDTDRKYADICISVSFVLFLAFPFFIR
jgi:hypothetical protein